MMPMDERNHEGWLVKVVLVLALAGFLAAGGAVVAGSIPKSGISPQVHEALSAAVGKWIAEQTKDKKNEYDKPSMRGYFSRSFKPLEGDTYLATVHLETAEPESKKTERYALTLKKKGGTEFEVAGSELKDTYVGLHRPIRVQCTPFQKFQFDREGMKLAGSNGELCTAFYRGEVAVFYVTAGDLTYDYEPPAHAQDLHYLRQFHALFTMAKADHQKEMYFTPAAVLGSCDPHTCRELIDQHFTGLGTKLEPSAGNPIVDGGTASKSGIGTLLSEAAKERRENAFAHFSTPAREGQRFYEVFVLREVDPFKYPGAEDGVFDSVRGSLPGSGVVLTYNNWGGFEVTFAVYPRRIDVPEQLFGEIFGYYSEKTAKELDPYAIETREDQSSRFHQVYSVKGDVDLGIVDPEMLSADLEIGIELKKSLRELPFFIQSIPQRDFKADNKPRQLYVNSIQLDGEELTWTKTGQLGGIVVLPKEMPAGTRLKLRISFDTRAMYKMTPTFTYVSRFGWMPFVRFGDFIDEFELTMRVPTGFTMLGIGHQVSEEQQGNISSTTWKSDSPVVFPSVTFGKYHTVTAGKDFKPAMKGDTVIPVTVSIDQNSAMDWDITPDNLRPIAQQATNAINLYTEISGVDYPYGKLNLVNDPFGFLYGQAPSSLIYLGQGVFKGEASLAPYFRNATGIANFLKSVVAHEVGHQWWGSRVSNANDRNYWFVESLAEYFSALYLEAVYGRNEYLQQVEEWRQNIINSQLKASVQNASAIWSGEDGFGSYQAAVYNKGPYAFHMLREVFGDDKFFEALKKMSMELTEKREIVTLDVQRSMERALGGVDEEGNAYTVDLSWFFNQWLRGSGVPQYRFVYDVREAEDGGWVIEGTVHQRVVIGSLRNFTEVKGEFYRGVVDVTVHTGKNDYNRRLVVEGAETPFRFKVAEKPLDIELNKNKEMLAMDVLVNQKWN